MVRQTVRRLGLKTRKGKIEVMAACARATKTSSLVLTLLLWFCCCFSVCVARGERREPRSRTCLVPRLPRSDRQPVPHHRNEALVEPTR